MKLSDQDINFIKLILRSPDAGDGWRRVSAQLWVLCERFGRQELVEYATAPEGGGKIRLSDRGIVLTDYI